MKIAKHIIGQPVAQGDVMLIPVTELPANGYSATATENGAYIVTHSETGHHHVVMERQTSACSGTRWTCSARGLS